ncbi:hypothetical protein J2X01_003753 [Arthrobacter ginsengisoli]|uniref:Uncharacterized protein n=1 Tax=Arthrobacter ginsengisoli TaxID=1356565 RepID=A0ABU1UH07_9MICC|nr:hypothetical protein [Arthrobacter ginsengisoli]MDR7084443.1 hypothetical protein [Arthrobacter ginsengisoli]
MSDDLGKRCVDPATAVGGVRGAGVHDAGPGREPAVVAPAGLGSDDD